MKRILVEVINHFFFKPTKKYSPGKKTIFCLLHEKMFLGKMQHCF